MWKFSWVVCLSTTMFSMLIPIRKMQVKLQNLQRQQPQHHISRVQVPLKRRNSPRVEPSTHLKTRKTYIAASSV